MEETVISYRFTQDFSAESLERLFLSVKWSSGEFPDKLVIAMKNSHRVVSAWDKGRLIGLMNALSDGTMTVYFHYLLVDPEYQGRGIGLALVNNMKKYYKDYARLVLIGYKEVKDFYLRCGFVLNEHSYPFFITELST